MEREQSTTSLPQLKQAASTSRKAQRTELAADAASAARSATPNSNGALAAAPSASSEAASIASAAGERKEDDDGDGEVAGGGKRKSSKAKSSGKKAGRSETYNHGELLILAKSMAGVGSIAATATGTNQSKPAMLEQAVHRFHQLEDASVKYHQEKLGKHISYPFRDFESIKSQHLGLSNLHLTSLCP